MQNPFNESEKPKEHQFFKEMTSAINEWMLKQYPAFDEQLVTKINTLKKLQDDIHLSFHKHKQIIIDEKENTKDFIISQINEFLEKTYPDFSDKLRISAEWLEKATEKHAKNAKTIEEKLKKIISSDTLYQDVYKMRDEVAILKKELGKFTDKLKKVFS